MNPLIEATQNTRRDFLTTAASGLGGIALTSLMSPGSSQAATSVAGGIASNPLAPKQSHFPSKAKSCICIFMAGAPSHLDLFNYRPTLQKLDGKPMPESLLKDMRFAFLQKESALLMGSKRTFKQHGESGMWFSRSAAKYCQLCRRHLHDKIHADRPVQSSSRSVADANR